MNLHRKIQKNLGLAKIPTSILQFSVHPIVKPKCIGGCSGRSPVFLLLLPPLEGPEPPDMGSAPLPGRAQPTAIALHGGGACQPPV